MSLSNEALRDFEAHLDELEREYGFELSMQERQDVLQESVANGFSPDATADAFEWITETGVSDTADDDDALDPDDEFEGDDDVDNDDGFERFQHDLVQSAHRLRIKLGRPLTEQENEILLRGGLEQAQRGEFVDAEEVLDAYQDVTGEKVGWALDLDNDEDRVAWMTQRANDLSNPEPEDPDREYDLDDDKDRVDFMVARAEGAEFEDAA